MILLYVGFIIVTVLGGLWVLHYRSTLGFKAKVEAAKRSKAKRELIEDKKRDAVDHPLD